MNNWMYDCRRAFSGRILTRRETLLTAGRAGLSAAALGLSAVNARALPHVLHVTGQPEIYDGTYCMQMDNQVAPDVAASVPGDAVAVEVSVQVDALDSGRLIPLANAQVELTEIQISTAQDQGNTPENLRCWAATNTTGRTRIAVFAPDNGRDFAIQATLRVRHYKLAENRTMEFSAPVAFTGSEFHLESAGFDGRLAARISRTEHGYVCSARITLVPFSS